MATDAKTLVTRDKGPIDFPDRPEPPTFVPDGWLSIGLTIDATGKSLFSDSWDGKEVFARDLPPLWGFDGWDRALLIDGGLILSAIPGQSGSSIGGVWHPPTRSRLEIEPASASEYEAERRAAARYAKAVDWLRQRCFSGEILVYRYDVRMRRILSKQWANEDWFQWTIRHGISNRFGERGHLFVRKLDLIRALNRVDATGQSAITAPAVKAAKVSPKARADVADEALRGWVMSHLDAHKNDAKHPTEREIEQAARAHFAPATIKKLRDKIRAIPKPQGWNEKGRTPRQRHSA